MEKYNKKIINDYINGKDIKGYSTEELEDDKEFMMLVIEITSDKNIYNLCSDKVKKDYEFVKFIIGKYKNDIKFICKVADYYLDNIDDELSRTELIIMMSQLTKKDELAHNKYKTICDTMFAAKRVEIEVAKLKIDDDNISQDIGMGFLVIFDSFNSSKTITNCYAKKTIDEIFNEYDIDLENMLHEQFNNPEQIDKIGINNYMLNFIGAYDSMLASYLSTNIDLTEELRNRIRQVQKKWSKFNNIDEYKKYNLIFVKVQEYMEQVENEGLLSETDLLYYVFQELGIINKLFKYNGISSQFNDFIVDESDKEFLEDTLNISFIDRIHFNNIKRIVSTIAFSNNYNESKLQPRDNKKGKILKIDFNNSL